MYRISMIKVFGNELWRVKREGYEMRLHSLKAAVAFSINHRDNNNPQERIILIHNGKSEDVETENEAFFAYLKMS